MIVVAIAGVLAAIAIEALICLAVRIHTWITWDIKLVAIDFDSYEDFNAALEEKAADFRSNVTE